MASKTFTRAYIPLFLDIKLTMTILQIFRRINLMIKLNKNQVSGFPFLTRSLAWKLHPITLLWQVGVENNLFSLRAWEIWPIRYGAAVFGM